jgi:hypothetical protein
MSASLVVGDLLFIGAMKAVYMLNAHTLEFLDQAPTSEWVFSLCMLDDYTLLAGQSYGYLDLLGVNSSLTKINTLLKTKFDKVSHIYALTKTSKHGEFAIGGYDGMYFGSVIEKQIGISTESYLANKTVK